MPQIRNSRAFFFLLLFSLIFESGCSSSSSPSSNNNNNNNAVVIKPKLGSTFTDSVYYKDTTLTDQHSNAQVVVYTLIDTNMTVSGKSNVYVFTGTFDVVANRFDTVNLHYESNGDVSVYAPFAAGPFIVGSEWVTFPFATQTTSNITTFKSFLIDTVTITGQVQGSGTGSDVVAGQSLSTEKATMNANASSLTAGNIPATASVSFAPSIGFITHQVITDQGSALGYNLTGGSNKILISYTLK